MTEPRQLSLADQRQILRLRLLAQRQEIVARIAPPETQGVQYPRSRTMRFLKERPAIVAGLAMLVASKFAGVRAASSLSAALGLIRTLRSALRDGQ